MNWLGIDYGEKRIGLALVAELLAPEARAGFPSCPRALGTLVRKGREDALARLVETVRSEAVTRVVVGVPLAPDGGLGLRGTQARNFARALAQRLEVPVVLQDERDSSREATERLVAMGVPQKKRAERVDAMAAVIILERHLQDGCPLARVLVPPPDGGEGAEPLSGGATE